MRLLLAIPLMFALSVLGQAQSWTALSAGLELQKGSLQDGQSRVHYLIVRCDPKIRKVKLVDVRGLLASGGNSLSPFNLRAVQQTTKAQVFFNAGSTSNLNFPDPVGWLKVSGKQISPPRPAAKDAGVLCVTGSKISVIRLIRGSLPPCTEAVQRGPFLGKAFVPEHGFSDGRYNRTIFAVDDQGRLLMLITQDPSSYSSLVSLLYSPSSGLNAAAALSMDGGLSSGAIVLASGKSNETEETVGDVDFLIASAIAIY